MPRSSFCDQPLLRVSRTVSACSRCRAAKIKCDGKLPACTACEKTGRESECSAANDLFARGKERSYVAALELRIEKLQRRLAYAQSRKDSVALHGPDARTAADSERKDSLASIRAAIHRKAARKRENSDVNSLVSDFGYLSVNATTRDFEPSVSNMTFARLVLAAATNRPVPEPRHAKFPPRQLAQGVIQYYMTNIYPLFPAFPETALDPVLDEMYLDHGQRQIKPADYWLLYLVLAIGSVAQSRSSQDDFYRNGVEFVSRALAVADQALTPGYVTQIQSLLLLAQYATLDPAHFDSWHLIGFACRAVIDLGYHQDPPQTHALDKAYLDARRRIFYCVYSLDRAISMVHARAFSFTDDAISVGFPSPFRTSRFPPLAAQAVPAPPPSSAVDPALLHFELRRAQSHWYQTLFQSNPAEPLPNAASFIWQMCHDMREWGESLPDALPAGFRELFDLELRYSYVYCLAPSARAPDLSAYGRTLIFEHVIAYLARMHDVVSATTAMTAALYTYHDALKVYFMGSQFVAVLRDAMDTLLAGAHAVPTPPPFVYPGRVIPPPPLPPRVDEGGGAGGDNLERSLRALERVSAVLQRYGQRWEDALALKGSFERMSAEVAEQLRVRQARAGLEQPPQQVSGQHTTRQPLMSSQPRVSSGLGQQNAQTMQQQPRSQWG